MNGCALLLTTCAPGLGWWAECECGWISRGYHTEQDAERAHRLHVAPDGQLALSLGDHQ